MKTFSRPHFSKFTHHFSLECSSWSFASTVSLKISLDSNPSCCLASASALSLRCCFIFLQSNPVLVCSSVRATGLSGAKSPEFFAPEQGCREIFKWMSSYGCSLKLNGQPIPAHSGKKHSTCAGCGQRTGTHSANVTIRLHVSHHRLSGSVGSMSVLVWQILCKSAAVRVGFSFFIIAFAPRSAWGGVTQAKLCNSKAGKN